MVEHRQMNVLRRLSARASARAAVHGLQCRDVVRVHPQLLYKYCGAMACDIFRCYTKLIFDMVSDIQLMKIVALDFHLLVTTHAAAIITLWGFLLLSSVHRPEDSCRLL